MVQVPKAGQLVAAELRRRIITGVFAPGDPLPQESALMEEFGVPRPSLREAFRILEAESIIVVLRGAHGGARVVAPDGAAAAHHMGLFLQYRGTPLVDVYRARTALEISAVGVLGDRKSTDELDRLEQLVEAGAALVGDDAAFAEHDVELHQTLMDLAGNATLAVMAGMLYRLIEAHNAVFIAAHDVGHEGPAARTAQSAHAKLVKLLRNGDVGAAQEHWGKHLDGVEKYMISDSAIRLVDVLS
jgi:DNA-binding FadR family transcriptional regulator